MTWTHWTPPTGSIPTLEVPSLEGVRSVHLIGIGGAGMRNLARLLAARGIRVAGSDIKGSAYLRDLEAGGIRTVTGHDPGNVGDVDAVIISSAIGPENVELIEARRRRIPIWKRQQGVAALASGRRAIAVAGTHGKTTTTSLLAVVLDKAGLDPSYLIGGDLNESGSGARHGEGDLFVFEADESDGSFLLIPAWTGIVTSIELDHVDFYAGGISETIRAFAEFVSRCQNVVACGDDENVIRVLDLAGTDAITYGTGSDNDIRVSVDALGPAGARGSVRLQDGSTLPLVLTVDGPHNLLNAAAVMAAAKLAGVTPGSAAEAVGGFEGVHRRFELRGRVRGAEIFDDYGHNPTEMEVTIATARRRSPGRLIALVQPHRYSRVEAMWKELGASVAGADLVVVTDVYGAAQAPIPGVTGKLVVDGVQLASRSTRTVYLPHRQDVVEFLASEIREGDLVITMGCGDVWMLGDAILERVREMDGETAA